MMMVPLLLVSSLCQCPSASVVLSANKTSSTAHPPARMPAHHPPAHPFPSPAAVGVTAAELRGFVEQCTSRYEAKRIDPGSTVGAFGAQSIGECN